jgi:hypothetical protein
MIDAELLEIARKHYEQERRKRDGFEKDEVWRKTEREVARKSNLSDRFRAAAVTAAIDRVDAACTGNSVEKGEAEGSRQGLLFDRDGPVEGVIRLGKGSRIDKEFARLEHWQQALQQNDENRFRVDGANDEFHRQMALLIPYWPPGGTLREAWQAYTAANGPIW